MSNTKLVEKRYDFVLLFDVKDGNPNGDPDAGNLPRTDPETGQGLVTDVAIKRKIRNYVALTREYAPPHNIYMRDGAILNEQHEEAFKALGLTASSTEDEKSKTKKRSYKQEAREATQRARAWMCENYFDIRTFGAVMSTGDFNCGQVRGPVQLTFARSVHRVVAAEHAITRVAVTNAKDAERKEHEMGRKSTVPYGLYRLHGFVSAPLAKDTGFSDGDLELLWESCARMFDHDRSAARGEMTTRALAVFEHGSALGERPAHECFARLAVTQKVGVPRDFTDFDVTLDGRPFLEVSEGRVICHAGASL